MSSLRTPPRKTLWEEGRHPGRLVAHAAAVVALVVVVGHLLLADGLTLAYDAVFVLSCVGAALAVRPRDFFVVGVLPPLLMAGTMLVLAIVARSTIADKGDGIVQATVSGLAHHAGSLVLGYGLALVVLALRQVAARNAGSIRSAGRGRPGPSRSPRPPRRRTVAPTR
ncbi:MAG: DUF6542 domain-containing protein [Nocardioides sp.]